MTQKNIESDKSISDLLQTIEPTGIADQSMRHTVEVLLNLIEHRTYALTKNIIHAV